MDELIKRITEKTGISEDQARSAVNTVSAFLKEKLPAPLAGQVDNALSGAGGLTHKLGDGGARRGARTSGATAGEGLENLLVFLNVPSHKRHKRRIEQQSFCAFCAFCG